MQAAINVFQAAQMLLFSVCWSDDLFTLSKLVCWWIWQLHGIFCDIDGCFQVNSGWVCRHDCDWNRLNKDDHFFLLKIHFMKWSIYHVPMRLGSTRMPKTPSRTYACKCLKMTTTRILVHIVIWSADADVLVNDRNRFDFMPPCWRQKWSSYHGRSCHYTKDAHCQM